MTTPPRPSDQAHNDARLRLLAETTGDALYQLRFSTMTYDYLSPGIEGLTGYGVHEIMAMSFASLVLEATHADGRPADLEQLRQRRLAGQVGPIELDYRVRCKNGGEKWLSDHSFPYHDDDGRLIGSVGVLRDITRRKTAELAQRRLVEDLRQALDQVRTLSGLLPICANCKKIRDDKGYWQQIEHYLASHSGASFSHGLCPDCVRQLYPELKGENIK